MLNAVRDAGVSTYVARLQRRLADGDIVTAPLLLMQSNGGVAGARHDPAARRR